MPTKPSEPGRLYSFKTLPLKGITFSKNYLRKLVKSGSFPAPIYLSERRPAWTEAMLDDWIADRVQARDGQAPSTPCQSGEDDHLDKEE